MEPTKEITLTGDWQQVTTGDENALLQTVKGVFALCSSETNPTDNQAYHIFSERIVTKPTKAWVKTFSPGIKLIITYM